MPLNDVTYNVKIKTTSDNSGISESQKAFQDLSSKATHVAKEVGVALLATGAAAIGFGISSVKAFSESQDVLAQTNAVIKSTGGVAGVSADEVQKLASALQKTTKFSDEDTRSVENLLLTFTAIGKDIFPQATKTVLDMATALGEDTKSASIQLGKALQDPVMGITVLKRVGVNFTEAQKEVIKKLVDTGQSAKAQQLILKELNTEFGGSAVAAGSTFAGSLAKLKNSFNDVQESIGETLVKGITPLALRLSEFVASDKFQKWLKDAVQWLNDNLPKAIQWVTNTLLPKLKEAFNDVWPAIKECLKIAGELVGFLIDHQWVFWALVGVLGAVKVAMFLQGALPAFQMVMTGATMAFGGLQALIASPLIMPAIAVAAALLAIGLVLEKFLETKNTIEHTNIALQGSANSQIDAITKLKGDYYVGDKATRDRAQKALHGLGVAGFANGTSFAPGGLSLVGENGPELVNLPRGAQVKTNSETRQIMQGNKSVTIGTVILSSPSAVKSFFEELDRDNLLSFKGLSPVRGIS